MQFTPVSRRSRSPERDRRVYADLDDLIRLQFKAKGFSYLPRQPVHSVLYGRHASRLRGRGLNFEELRNYLPGDDIRNVDWKATSRTSRPHVRVFTEERDRPVWLLVDQRASMFFGSRERLKSVTAAEAAAVSAWRVLGLGDRVGALVFDDTEIVEIKPQRSRNQVMRILGEVVRKNHALRAGAGIATNPGMFNEVLRRLLPLVKHDTLVTLISDVSGADDDSVRMVTQLNQHNDVILAFVYDPMEQELPGVGRLAMSDDTGQIEVDTSRSALRRGFEEHFQDGLRKMQALSRKQAIPLLQIGTHSPVLDQVREQLGRRTARRN
ncbi:MAG: DUF58 domain-containing protein [Pseudomonadota bacterium]|nr:DUF58 domain-containing protein [Pseudomonadota bacterium]